MPGLLGSRIHFKKQFSDPVEHGQRHTATKRELATGRKAMQRLARKMSGWFLRRTKTLIKDQLPKKEDRVRTAFVYIRNSLSCFIYSENTSFEEEICFLWCFMNTVFCILLSVKKIVMCRIS